MQCLLATQGPILRLITARSETGCDIVYNVLLRGTAGYVHHDQLLNCALDVLQRCGLRILDVGDQLGINTNLDCGLISGRIIGIR